MDRPGQTKAPVQGGNGIGAPDPVVDTAFLALHAEREALERELTHVQQLQRFGGPAGVEAARERETALLQALDRLLTRIRAAEYRRRPGARRW